MSPDQIYVAAITLGTLAALMLELLPIDQVGLLALVAIVVSGVLGAEEAVAGFGHPAVITIGSLLVVAQGLQKTGALAWVGRILVDRAGGRPLLFLVLLCLIVGAASGFVNNTPIVAVFIPLVLALSCELKTPPSKLLIPLSYASILGGMCTLLGTSTNILVSEIIEVRGIEPIGMFEILPVGASLFLAGMVYILIFGRRLLPSRPSLAFNLGKGKAQEFVTEVAVKAGSSAVGRELGHLLKKLQARLLLLLRGEEMFWAPSPAEKLRSGDILLVKGSVNSIAEVKNLPGVELLPEVLEGKVSFDPRSMRFVELFVSFGSMAVGRRVKDLKLRHRAGLVVVGVMRKGRHLREKVSGLSLVPGDVLLAFGDEYSISEVERMDDFTVTDRVQEQVVHRRRAPMAVAVLALMVTAIITGFLHISVAALSGALAMVLGGCLSPGQTYRAVNWRIIFLLVGALSLGRALDQTGLALQISHGLVDLAGGGAFLSLAVLYLVTSVFTELLTNGAVAVLMTPVALSVAATLGLDPRTFVMAVLFASSASFMTPVGYQTNTMIYGVGGYKYKDFVIVGLPLQVSCFVLAMLLVPWLWPFTPA